MEEEKKVLQNKNKWLTALVVLLGLLLFGSIIYTYKMSNENKALEDNMISEKLSIQKDLAVIKDSLDVAIASNTTMSEDLMIERDKVVKLIEEINNSKSDIASLQAIKNQFSKLKSEVVSLVKENNVLKKKNERLLFQRDSTKIALAKIQKDIDTIASKNKNLIKEVEKGSKLSILTPQVTTFKKKNSGKLVPTDKARNTDIFTINITISENQIAKSGLKLYYIQVLDSDNNILGEKNTVKFDNRSLSYSYVARINFQNNLVQNSTDLPVKDLKKGLFFVNVFDKNEIVAKTTFQLK
jgi:hypothetical protein